MSLLRQAFVCLSIVILLGCGSSASEKGSNENAEVKNEDVDSKGAESEDIKDSQDLVLAFDPSPLEPNVFNIAAREKSLEHDFNPGEAIRSSWFMSIQHADGSLLKEGESYLFDAAIYLSDDALIDTNDLKLFSIVCRFPETVGSPCGNFGSFITVYAPDNSNTFSTTSIPLEVSGGLTDFTVDSSEFLDEIPKATNLIFNACLQEQSDVCDQHIVGINLL